MRADSILNTPIFPVSGLKCPRRAETFKVCCLQTFGKPSPLSGCQVTVSRREACTLVAHILVLDVGIVCPLSPPPYPDYIFFEDPGKFCDREHHGFLCVPWLLQPTPTPIDVIYRVKYDTFTGRMLKTFTGKSMTFKHIETTVFGCVSGNINYSTNT